MVWLLVFLAFLALDFAWAKYMASVAAKRAHAAGFWSAVITLVAGYATIQYVDNNWLLLPALVGGYLGTWIAVKHELRG